ncbi:ATP-dependent (S)-NAD(P)H-hydrate dehydratase-like [Paramacrobiotus metropolitanus]|uniref:ATP-dependent (S)-NAD(P)H-hydrate dehydratase-like n=1 Tax=Paramacrobiotus metropolitanus TaxID=2943436 RepID=UPI0024457B1A|nr:ATP-dependent (S)-NAD(P)H-hydrate dehydratase-like [Paramacrobiotus metropolitanus]
MGSKIDDSQLMGMVAELFPALDRQKHKGEAGRVGVIGGSEVYTGAPFFSAITTMRVGCDQTHVFCAKDAAIPIKSYSPDLIVHPTLDGKNAEKDVSELYERLNVLIVGPGLGRTDSTMQITERLIGKAKEKELPIVVDADGLWLINQKPDVIKGYSKAILTPNVMEAKRLWKAMEFPEDSWTPNGENVKKLSQAMGNVAIVVKGSTDTISDGINSLESGAEFGLKRCGGQGDIMTGALGTFLIWANQAKKDGKNQLIQALGPLCCAAYAASILTRRCSKLAFEDLGRSMIASDMLAKIPAVVKELQNCKK